jgi:uncharacterized protein
MEQEQTITRVAAATDNSFIQQVYAWMAIGLLTTSVASVLTIGVPGVLEILLGNMFVFYGLILVELGVVIYLSARVAKMSITQARLVYFLYSVLSGVTLSVVFLFYATASIASAFLVAAGTFAAVSWYGYITKKDLSTVGQYAFMGLIGVIIASLVNLLFRNEGFDLILSYITVLVFVALTAYDTQKIKALNASLTPGSEEASKASILGALTLYLDFINLFLNILRIMGRRR